MSERLELVRAVYAFTSGDLVGPLNDDEWVRESSAAFGHIVDPDFEFVLVRGEIAEESFPGLEGFYTGMREWLSGWESYEVEVDNLLDLDGRVVVFTIERGRSRSGGVPVEQKGAVVWSFRGDKVLRVETYLQRAAALAALGIAG